MLNKKYVKPEAELIVLSVEDVITASPVDVDTQWNENWNAMFIE